MRTDKEAGGTNGKFAQAFSLYVNAKEEPVLSEIAQKVGLHPETVVQHAHARDWARKRGLVQAQSAQLATQARTEVAARTDALAVRRVAGWFDSVTSRYDEIIAGVITLPINDPDENKRRFQLRQQVELLNETIKGAGMLVELAKSVGLALGPKAAGGNQEKIDFGKLTHLSLVVMQAQKDSGQKPVEVFELEDLPKE